MWECIFSILCLSHAQKSSDVTGFLYSMIDRLMMDRLMVWVEYFINKEMYIKDPVHIVLRGHFLQVFLLSAGISDMFILMAAFKSSSRWHDLLLISDS